MAEATQSANDSAATEVEQCNAEKSQFKSDAAASQAKVAEYQQENKRLKEKVNHLAQKTTKKQSPESPPEEPVVKAPELPSCDSGPKWGKCQPTAFFGYSDNWKRHRVCRDDTEGAEVTCETQECQSQAAQSSTSIKVDVQAGCLNNKTRMAEMPYPFCAYTQGLSSFSSVSAGKFHTC